MNERIAALEAVTNERARQDVRWGEQNHDDVWWLAILTEEVGELAQAILHDRFGGAAQGQVQAELVQVAAVAVAWLECLARREGEA
jgi:NTP pyrophosphatase (non-canonical NTP hydrolase)